MSERDPLLIGLVDFLDALVHRHAISGALADDQLRSRSKVVRVCDRCDEDFADEEGMCVDALHPHFFRGQTVCRNCVEAFAFTGCQLTGQHYEAYLFGRSDRPEWWDLQSPSWDDLRVGLVRGAETWKPRAGAEAA